MKRVASTVVLGSSSGGTCSLSPVGVRLAEELGLVVGGLQAFQGKRDALAFEADDDDRQEGYRDDEEVLLVVGDTEGGSVKYVNNLLRTVLKTEIPCFIKMK